MNDSLLQRRLLEVGANQFICPNGDKVNIDLCLSRCPHHIRCMGKPTLEAVANSVKDRKLGRKYSVTELIAGTREMYLKKTTDYAVDPQDQIFAMHGTAVHSICEKHSSSFILTEVRLANSLYTGQIDAYGDLLGNGKKIILDYKVTSSFKAAMALGYYKVEEPTGEFYKTGLKKGQPKTRKVLKTDGRKQILQWAIQVNAYRMLLEEHNFPVEELWVQMYIRDFSLRISKERNINQPIYLIKVNKISDIWLKKYFEIKKKRLDDAIKNGVIPDYCRNSESWGGRKCESYCSVFDACKRAYAEKLASSSSDEVAA